MKPKRLTKRERQQQQLELDLALSRWIRNIPFSFNRPGKLQKRLSQKERDNLLKVVSKLIIHEKKRLERLLKEERKIKKLHSQLNS